MRAKVLIGIRALRSRIARRQFAGGLGFEVIDVWSIWVEGSVAPNARSILVLSIVFLRANPVAHE